MMMVMFGRNAISSNNGDDYDGNDEAGDSILYNFIVHHRLMAKQHFSIAKLDNL